MKCPKCHNTIDDNTTVCPHCKKVLKLECPNCGDLSESPICEKCGFILLTKCTKCGKVVMTKNKRCSCGFPVAQSLATSDCESDEFACLIIKFENLDNIKRELKNNKLYQKFLIKLKNQLTLQFAGLEAQIIQYENTYVVNMNKELSLPTSANKAVRLGLKILNSYVDLNKKLYEKFKQALDLHISIVKKAAEDLLVLPTYKTNMKMLEIKKNDKTYLQGMQISLDQYIHDSLKKDFEMDSLYSIEHNNTSVMFYEIILDKYIIPPVEKNESEERKYSKIPIIKKAKEPDINDEDRSFKVFDIKARCRFQTVPTVQLFEYLEPLKIISLRSEPQYKVDMTKLVLHYKSSGRIVFRINCNEETQYQPWGALLQLFRDYFELPIHSNFINPDTPAESKFPSIYSLLFRRTRQGASIEDIRYSYMNDFARFLSTLKNSVVIVDGFEHLDDTSLETFKIYFDKYKEIIPTFIFITNRKTSVHSKFKNLLQEPIYGEYLLTKSNIDLILPKFKEDVTNFIYSFYFEKIRDNFNGSLLYFENAIKYLFEKNILVNYDNYLVVRNKASFILPVDLNGLLKARLKHLSTNEGASLILACSTILGPKLDMKLLQVLKIEFLPKNIELLEESGFIQSKGDFIYINNYNIIKPLIEELMTDKVLDYLSKTILASIGKGLDPTISIILMGKLASFKEEYLMLWNNAEFSMQVGDYDAYLKNSLGFLSLIEHIEENIPEEDIQEHKMEVYKNILQNLYSYSPKKIYPLGRALFNDIINSGNDESILKLSNLLLQGALISNNYSIAQEFLHHILSHLDNPTLIVNNAVNSKFLLLQLINIQILFNIGNYKNCVEIANEILSILSPEILNKIKPQNFSSEMFASHLFETYRLVAFSKLFLAHEDWENFYSNIKNALGREFPDKNAFIALSKYLKNNDITIPRIDNCTNFEKIIFLILKEFSELKDDYRNFAQNIYQAKLLSKDLNQIHLELFCDLLIGYAYYKIGMIKKARYIYSDVLNYAEECNISIIKILARYFISIINVKEKLEKEALLLINNSIAELHKYESRLLHAFMLLLYINIGKATNLIAINEDTELANLSQLVSDDYIQRFSTCTTI